MRTQHGDNIPGSMDLSLPCYSTIQLRANRGRGSAEVKNGDLMRRKEEVGLRCWWCAASVEIGANRRACNRGDRHDDGISASRVEQRLVGAFAESKVVAAKRVGEWLKFIHLRKGPLRCCSSCSFWGSTSCLQTKIQLVLPEATVGSTRVSNKRAACAASDDP